MTMEIPRLSLSPWFSPWASAVSPCFTQAPNLHVQQPHSPLSRWDCERTAPAPTTHEAWIEKTRGDLQRKSLISEWFRNAQINPNHGVSRDWNPFWESYWMLFDDHIWPLQCGTLWLMSPPLASDRRERSTVTVSVLRSEGLQSGLALMPRPWPNPNVALVHNVKQCV